MNPFTHGVWSQRNGILVPPGLENLIALMRYDTNFADISKYQRPPSFVGTPPVVSTGPSKFAEKSLESNGDSIVTYPLIDDAIQLRNRSWQIECQLYVPASVTFAAENTVAGMWREDAEDKSWLLDIDALGRLRFWTSEGGTPNFHVVSDVPLPRDQFVQITMYRKVVADGSANSWGWACQDGDAKGAISWLETFTFDLTSTDEFSVLAIFGVPGQETGRMPADVRMNEFRMKVGATDYGSNPIDHDVPIQVAPWPAPTAAKDPLTLFQTRFIGANPDDESYHNRGAPTTHNGGTVIEGAYHVDRNNSATPSTPNILYYEYEDLIPDGINAVTFEFFVFKSGPVPNIAFTIVAAFSTNAGGGGGGSTTNVVGYFGDTGTLCFSNGFDTTVEVSPSPTPTHVAIVMSATGRRVYFGGTRLINQGGNWVPPAEPMIVRLGDPNGYTSGFTDFQIQGARVRNEELYTGESFEPPAFIPAP